MASTGDLKICLRNISRLAWKLRSKVNTARNLMKALTIWKPSMKRKMKKDRMPSNKVEVAALSYCLLTSS